jgi:hypothetical protein
MRGLRFRIQAVPGTCLSAAQPGLNPAIRFTDCFP